MLLSAAVHYRLFHSRYATVVGGGHSSAIESMQCKACVVLSIITALAACLQAYPALFELVTALHGLPFELNAKVPSLQLSQPIPGSTMLSKLPAGGEVHRRLDSVVGGGQTTGYAVTAGMPLY
jgi:hypothetical protein